MDVERLFRSLVTNQRNPYFDPDIRFSFKTIYNLSVYSYCCCECPFQNEFLTYISKDGVVNEEVYNKMIQSIKEGKCPHVDDVDKKFVKESIIYGVNIAAAVDNYDEILTYRNAILTYLRYNPPMFSNSIFELRPFHLAALKQNIDILRLILNWIDEDETLITCFSMSLVPEIRITESGIHLPLSTSPGSQISVYTYKALEYAVKLNSIKSFKLLSIPIREDRHALDAFSFALRENLTQCQKAFVRNVKGMVKREPYELSIERIMDISALPVLYENANIFEKILKILRKSSLDKKQDI